MLVLTQKVWVRPESLHFCRAPSIADASGPRLKQESSDRSSRWGREGRDFGGPAATPGLYPEQSHARLPGVDSVSVSCKAPPVTKTSGRLGHQCPRSRMG